MAGLIHEVESGLVGLLFIIGAILLFPLIPALIYAEYYAIVPFVVTAGIAIILSYRLNKKYPLKDKYSLEAAVIIAPLAWLLISLIGMLPYLWLTKIAPLDALFETMSGFTTTGMTVINRIEELPLSLLFWRSFTQWIGGIGVIVLFTLLFTGGMSTWRFYSLEGREEKFTTSIKSTIKRIWIIYSLLTALCAFALCLCGMSPFDAINHAMTTLSTGGFSTRTEGIMAFESPAIKIVLCVFMTLGAISFTLFYSLFKFDFRKIFSDSESKTLLGIIFFSGVLVASLLITLGLGILPGILDGFFNVISILTTTGYTSMDLGLWPATAKALLLILMIIGGSAGSTAGGIKVWRIVVLYRIGKREVEKMVLPPSAVRPIKIGGRVFDEEYVMKVGSFFFIYIFAVLIQFLLLTLVVPDIVGALSLVLSAQGNVGPAFYSMSGLGSFAKLILIFGMWFGRLELFPVLALFSKGLPKALKEEYESWKQKRAGQGDVIPNETGTWKS